MHMHTHTHLCSMMTVRLLSAEGPTSVVCPGTLTLRGHHKTFGRVLEDHEDTAVMKDTRGKEREREEGERENG